MRMKYRPYKAPEDILMVGDVRRCLYNGGGVTESFYAIVTAVGPDTVSVRRLYGEDSVPHRYLIKDVGPTGLEYAMFVDPKTIDLPPKAVGRKYGRLSKMDMRNIRK